MNNTTTTQQTHTPGPWHRNIKPASKYNKIFAKRNTHVCHLATSALTEEEIESNCDLIAAAPQLLESLKECMEIFGKLYSDGNEQAYSKAYKAIAKAEGKTL